MNINPYANTPIDLSNIPSGGGTLQLRFAAMQLKMAVANKNEAMAFIDSIQAEREQSQEVAALIKQAKELQAQAESSGGQVKMPYEMLEYFEKIDIKHYHQSGLASAANKAKLPTSDSSNQADTKKIKTFDDSSQPDSDFAFGGTKSPAEGIKFTDDEWAYNIESLESYLETLGQDTQQKMVYVQDFMGQYDAYLNGANTLINKLNDILSNMARNVS